MLFEEVCDEEFDHPPFELLVTFIRNLHLIKMQDLLQLEVHILHFVFCRLEGVVTRRPINHVGESYIGESGRAVRFAGEVSISALKR